MVSWCVVHTNQNVTATSNDVCQVALHRKACPVPWVDVIMKFVIPGMCLLGALGNACNLTVLALLRKRTRQRYGSCWLTRTPSESQGGVSGPANTCLLALAVSDMMFCLSVLPSYLVPPDETFPTPSLLFHYSVFEYGIINMFITSSTLLTVAMALERYLACCLPLRPASHINSRRIKNIIIFVVIFSCLFNIPTFFRRHPHFCNNEDSINRNKSNIRTLEDSIFINVTSGTSSGIYDYSSSSFYTSVSGIFYNKQVDNIYRILWAIFLNIIPILILCFCNINLLITLRKSYKFHRQFKNTSSANQPVTQTLIAIIVMFLVLVAPSELALVLAREKHGIDTPAFVKTETVFNLMQTVNFSTNFLLYLIILPHFRHVLHATIRCSLVWSTRPRPCQIRKHAQNATTPTVFHT